MKRILVRSLYIALILGLASCTSGPKPSSTPGADDAFKRNDYETAFALYMTEAEKGNPEAQFRVGYMYSSGKGTAKDQGKAIEWLTRSGGSGYAMAQYNLGLIYGNGLGVEKNPGEAARWYKMAADQDLVDAQINLAIQLYKGDGVQKNPSAAAELFDKAAEKGNERAQTTLGMMLFKGDGVAQDYKRAHDLFKAAAKQGNPFAQHYLGIMYAKGTGVTQSRSEAIYWYHEAGLTYMKLGMKDKAVAMAETIGAVSKDSPAYMDLAEKLGIVK